MKKIVLMGVAAVSLSACGGGGGSTTATDAEVGGASGITSGEAIARFTELNNGFNAVSSNTTLQTDLPTSGNVAYSGNLGFDIRGALPGGGDDVDASMVGDLNVTVAFGGTNQPISGDVTNILYADTDGNFDRPSGSLAFVGGTTTLPRNGLPDLEGVISADLDGTLMLDQGDGSDKSVTFDLDVSGQFGGNAGATSADVPTAMRGFVIGTASGGGLTLVIPNGRFAAEAPGANVLP